MRGRLYLDCLKPQALLSLGAMSNIAAPGGILALLPRKDGLIEMGDSTGFLNPALECDPSKLQHCCSGRRVDEIEPDRDLDDRPIAFRNGDETRRVRAAKFV